MRVRRKIREGDILEMTLRLQSDMGDVEMVVPLQVDRVHRGSVEMSWYLKRVSLDAKQVGTAEIGYEEPS